MLWLSGEDCFEEGEHAEDDDGAADEVGHAVAGGAFDEVAGEGGGDEGAEYEGYGELEEEGVEDEVAEGDVEDDGGEAGEGFGDHGGADGLFAVAAV